MLAGRARAGEFAQLPDARIHRPGPSARCAEGRFDKDPNGTYGPNVPHELRVIERIMREYADGKAMRRIADDLRVDLLR